ncbi:calcium-binding protein [Pelagibacterium sp.]|uniref:calcium-binding protein n=1 Tax=Pelagibacterium sp. TaxID=1967288 RepID=UPI003A930941
MTTYTSTGFTVVWGENDAVAIETDTELKLYAPDGTTTFSYTTYPHPDGGDEADLADITVDGGVPTINGSGFGDTEDGVYEVSWNDNGTPRTTVVLVIEEIDVDSGAFGTVNKMHVFYIDGAALPTINTLNKWNNFDNNQITGVDVASGDYAPSVDIPLVDVFADATENDVLIGTNGYDELIGGLGNDLLDPKDNTDFEGDLVQAGAGKDKIRLSKVEVGYVDISHSDLDEGIVVSIDGNANTGKVNKGINGSTKIIDVANPMLADGLSVGGTSSDDTFRITVADDGWLGLGGGGGDDTFVIGQSTGTIRLDYRLSVSGVVARLDKGRINDDGLSGSDRLKGDGHITELRTSMFDDRVVGSDANERFILMAGTDTLDAGAGTDTLRYDRNGVEAVNVDLAKGIAKGVWRGDDFKHKISNVENVTGSRDDDDVIKGDSGNNAFYGRGGNDTLSGGGGRDTLAGEEGNDVLTGGGAADVFVFSSGNDRVTDFKAGTDAVDLDEADGIRNFRDLVNNHMEQKGDDVLIVDDNGDKMRLLDVDLNDLSADDFLF